jgi:hypothetical protein
MVSQGHVHVLRVTCEGDEPSSSQTLSVTHQTEVLKDGGHVAKNGANSESSWSCLRESLIQANRRGDDTTAIRIRAA